MCCSCERGGGGDGALRGFFEPAVLYSISFFFPLWHLISKPFALTVLTANVKLTDVLELDPKQDSYKVTPFWHHRLHWGRGWLSVHTEHPAAFPTAVLTSGLAVGQGAAPTPA